MIHTEEALADHALSTRERILAATREVYERSGTRGTTTREIAERARVNEATIFRHFGSKTALICAMREGACDARDMLPEIEVLPGDDLRGDLLMLCRIMYEAMVRRRALIVIGLAEEETDPDATTPLQQPQRIAAQLSTYLQRQIDRGTIKGDAGGLAAIMMGMMFALAVKSKSMAFLSQSPTALIDQFVDTLLNGVRN